MIPTKTNIRAALKGWGSSGNYEIKQSAAVEQIFKFASKGEDFFEVYQPQHGKTFEVVVQNGRLIITRLCPITGTVEEVFQFYHVTGGACFSK